MALRRDAASGGSIVNQVQRAFNGLGQMTTEWQEHGTAVQRVTYSYDAWGNLIQRAAWNGSTTTTERYGLDGSDPAKPDARGNEGFDAWADLDGSNALTERRLFGVGFDEVVARQSAAGTVNWYVTDRQGSVREVIDNSASVVATTTYSAFGKVASGSL